jgi:hypothetical protein
VPALLLNLNPTMMMTSLMEMTQRKSKKSLTAGKNSKQD